MSEAAKYDAVVVGAGAGGLAAAAYLGRAGFRVVLLEARKTLEEASPRIVHALDPRLVSELRLARHGLEFGMRDMALVGLQPGGEPIVLGRDPHAAARSIGAHSAADAEEFPRARRAFFKFARAMRAWWWSAIEGSDTAGVLHDRAEQNMLALLEVCGAEAFLGARFESDALRALLTFDVTADGFSPDEPGSALALAWHAAQEVAGLQGACASVKDGTLIAALARAAVHAGVAIRTDARVAGLLWAKDAAQGVVLESGEEIAARITLSSLSRAATSALAPVWGFGAHETARRTAARIGRAWIRVALDGAPSIAGVPQGARFILAERSEIYAAAHAEARAGQLPAELALECTLPEPGRMDVLVHPLPLDPREGWEALGPRLAARIAAALARHTPELKDRIAAIEINRPRRRDPVSLARLLAPARLRARTPIPRLYLCGEDAEPMPAVSGRAGRFAARFALGELS